MASMIINDTCRNWDCYWLATYFRSYKSRLRSSQIQLILYQKGLVENEEQVLKDLQRVLRTQKALRSARWVLVTHAPLCSSLICQTPKCKTNAGQLKKKVNDYAKVNLNKNKDLLGDY